MSEDFEEKKTEAPDWQLYIGMARRHFWHFLLPFFFGWLAVWGASWFMPSVYRSGTLILVEEPTVPQEFVASNVSGDLQNRLQSITQQILSRTRLLSIINQFDLYPKYKHNVSPDDLVERMRRDIEIEQVRSADRQNLTAFNVYYSSDKPATAQRVTSELTNLFISENLEVRQQQSESTTNFLEGQLAAARDELAAQEAKVREFKGKYLGQLPGQLQTNLQIMGGLQTQLQTEEDALNRARQQNAYLESLVNQYHTLQGSTKSSSAAPMGIPAIDQELERLRAQLADLSSHYTERHPDVRKVKEQIAKTERIKKQLASDPTASATTSSSNGDSGGAPMMQLQSQLKANQVEIADHQRTIQQIRAKLGDYQGRLNLEPVLEQQLTDLTRGYEQSKADYDSLLKKKNESALATNLEKEQQGEHFRILDPPSLPGRPYSPNRLQLFGIGLAAGLAFGLGLSIVLELLDNRIYSEKALKRMMPADVIVEIPPLPTVYEQQLEVKRSRMIWASASAVLVSVLIAFAVTFLKG